MKYTVTAEEAAFTKAEKISRGVIKFDITPAQKSAKTMMTDWIDTELGSGRHLVMTTVMDGVYLDEIPVGEERLFFGRSDYFKDAGDIPTMPDVKVSAVLSVETGKFRLALKVKPESFEGTVRILWTAVKMEEKTVRPTGGEIPFYIENPPKVLHPGWKYTFSVHQDAAVESAPGAIVWSVSSESGEGEEYTGSIDASGELTAPQHPGIVEVTAAKEGTDFLASSFVVIAP